MIRVAEGAAYSLKYQVQCRKIYFFEGTKGRTERSNDCEGKTRG